MSESRRERGAEGESNLAAIVLAAGQGTRMRSSRPKPLHVLCGRPLVGWVLANVAELPLARAVVVVGHGGEQVVKALQEENFDVPVEFVEQLVQRGTGDAVAVGLTGLDDLALDEDAHVIVLPGDTPLLRPDTLAQLVDGHRLSGAAATVLTARLTDPTGYGRVLRDKNNVVARVVEEVDATEDERKVDEINTGIYCFRQSLLAPALRRLQPDNAQGEYYLTDVLAVLRDAGYQVGAVEMVDAEEANGVNDRVQLAEAERMLRVRINTAWMRAGVTFVDPNATYIDANVVLAPDVTLFPGVVLQGNTNVGAGSEIGPGCLLIDVLVGARARLEHTSARQASIGDDARVGPFAVLEPGANVPAGTFTGPFYTRGHEGSA